MKQLETLLLRYFHYLESKGRIFNAVLGIICTTLIGAFDLFAPDTVKHSFLYILPIGFATWFSGIRIGLAIVLLGTLFWSVNNVADSLLISVWNVSSTLLFLTMIAVVLHKTRELWENEKNLSRTDPLTGAINLRAFTELVEYEMLRAQREGLPYSLAYLDLDNFKSVNDTYGHRAGDELLRAIVANIVNNLRKTDMVARLGGDEFAIFFPATDQTSVQVVMQKVSDELTDLMKNSLWPTTFSMGVLTCEWGIHDLDRLISAADMLMYEVKKSGKNGIRFARYPATDPMV